MSWQELERLVDDAESDRELRWMLRGDTRRGDIIMGSFDSCQQIWLQPGRTLCIAVAFCYEWPSELPACNASPAVNASPYEPD